MNHKKRGFALIFNHYKFFDFNLHPRNGTDVDVANLTATFSALDFQVNLYEDFTLKEIEETLRKGKYH